MAVLPRWFHLLGSPPFVYRLAARLNPWLGTTACVLLATGFYWGLVVAPPDAVQGEVYRIIYIHPQAAYVGMMAYVVMAVASAVGYVWRIKVAFAVATAAAPIGASFTFCALVTGAFWGRPTWGTYWEWGDPRIMFELLLLFLFLGGRRRGERADHPLLGDLVEHAASGALGLEARQPFDRARDAMAVPDHGGGLYLLFLLASIEPIACRAGRKGARHTLDRPTSGGGG
jgi:ABC-type transport system involved in cytochrome c biogenesis permease subunit